MTDETDAAPEWAHEENARKRTISRAWPGDLRALLAAAEPHRLPARVLSAIDRGGWRRVDAIVGFAIAVRRMRRNVSRDWHLAQQVLAVAESLGIGVRRMDDDEAAVAHAAGLACASAIDLAARGTAARGGPR